MGGPESKASAFRTASTRFSGKEALFAAVMVRKVREHTSSFESIAPTGVTAEERLTSIATAMLMLTRALFGEDLRALRAEIGSHVARTVAFFLAACRHRGVD